MPRDTESRLVTAHIEELSDVLPELRVLFPQHYRELALNQDQVPLDPQYDIYLERARRGEVLCAVLRERGEVIGYFVGFVAPGLHYRTCLTLTMDIFYVRQERRAGLNGIRLFRCVEAEARRRGVQRWFMGSKLHADASALFKRLGAKPVETYYSLWLGD